MHRLCTFRWQFRPLVRYKVKNFRAISRTNHCQASMEFVYEQDITAQLCFAVVLALKTKRVSLCSAFRAPAPPTRMTLAKARFNNHDFRAPDVCKCTMRASCGAGAGYKTLLACISMSDTCTKQEPDSIHRVSICRMDVRRERNTRKISYATALELFSEFSMTRFSCSAYHVPAPCIPCKRELLVPSRAQCTILY